MLANTKRIYNLHIHVHIHLRADRHRELTVPLSQATALCAHELTLIFSLCQLTVCRNRMACDSLQVYRLHRSFRRASNAQGTGPCRKVSRAIPSAIVDVRGVESMKLHEAHPLMVFVRARSPTCKRGGVICRESC